MTSITKDKLYELWSGTLSEAEAKEMRDLIASDEMLKKDYDELAIIFGELKEGMKTEIKAPLNFSTEVMERLDESGFVVNCWRYFMKVIRSVLKAIIVGYWSMVLAMAFAIAGIIGYAHFSHKDLSGVLNQQTLENLASVFLTFLEGRFGVLMMLGFMAVAVSLLPMRAWKLASGAVAAGLSIFILRSTTTVFFNTDGIAGFMDADSVGQNNVRDRVVVIEKELPITPEYLEKMRGGQGQAKGKTASPQQPAPNGSLPIAQAVPPQISQKLTQTQNNPSEPNYGKRLERYMGSAEQEGPVAGKAAADMAIAPAPLFEQDDLRQQGYIGKDENRENYGKYLENPRLLSTEVPVSTFSIDVDTGSYANIRRFLKSGQLPPSDAVRIEELVNYFPYSYHADSDKPFSVNYEIAPSPFSKGRYILRVGIKAKPAVTQDTQKGWNLVFLVDVSGSMDEPNKLPLVKQSLKLLVDQMRPIDRVTLVTYAGQAGVALAPTSGSEKQKIKLAIDSLGAGGSTNGSGGIEVAYAQAEAAKIPGSVNRVILATDGDFNVGTSSFEGLMDLIERKRSSGISLTTVGFGDGNYQEHNMEQLADKGNGNYYYIDSFQEARKVFVSDLAGAMETVAKDVKFQLEFNPKKVSEYRLIGFDNRILKREDFNNDTVDAGEIGSGHTMTALYEIAMTDTPVADSAGDPLRYGVKATAAPVPDGINELGFLKIRAKAPEGSESVLTEYPLESSKVIQSIAQTDDDFRFAVAVAGFGQKLRHSSYAGSYTWGDVRALAQGAKGEDPFGYRGEFLGLVDAASSIKGN